jgi:hypothetical protein
VCQNIYIRVFFSEKQQNIKLIRIIIQILDELEQIIPQPKVDFLVLKTTTKNDLTNKMDYKIFTISSSSFFYFCVYLNFKNNKKKEIQAELG